MPQVAEDYVYVASQKGPGNSGSQINKCFMAGAIILFITGLTPLMIVLWKRNKRRKILAKGVNTTATITSVSTGYSNNPAWAVITYRTLYGDWCSGKISVAPHTFKPGDTLEIVYDREVMSNFVVPKGKSGFIIGVILAVAIFIFFTMVAVRLLMERT